METNIMLGNYPDVLQGRGGVHGGAVRVLPERGRLHPHAGREQLRLRPDQQDAPAVGRPGPRRLPRLQRPPAEGPALARHQRQPRLLRHPPAGDRPVDQRVRPEPDAHLHRHAATELEPPPLRRRHRHGPGRGRTPSRAPATASPSSGMAAAAIQFFGLDRRPQPIPVAPSPSPSPVAFAVALARRPSPSPSPQSRARRPARVRAPDAGSPTSPTPGTTASPPTSR